MAQSLSKILLHLIFSTKDREPTIPPELADELYRYLASACDAHGSHAYRIGGMPDHVHIACTLPRTASVSKLLEEIKKSSSKWIKERDRRCAGFAWQGGFGAFSLGQSQLDAVIQYIERQTEHHANKTFKEEFVEFLRKYKVDHDERYAWS
ncbi:MAG: IS200/IS605 family transposase [Verrucomicrobia bacterium]|jgi:putative transposase|nr:IS200/IS605 family transposase [Verrucomicrobiota bacterium]